MIQLCSGCIIWEQITPAIGIVTLCADNLSARALGKADMVASTLTEASELQVRVHMRAAKRLGRCRLERSRGGEGAKAEFRVGPCSGLARYGCRRGAVRALPARRGRVEGDARQDLRHQRARCRGRVRAGVTSQITIGHVLDYYHSVSDDLFCSRPSCMIKPVTS